MKKFGLIGYPLGHSFSRSYFAGKFEKENISDCEYVNFEIDSIDKIQGILESEKELIGFNVTIPYKQAIIPFLDELDDTAKGVGAVNTVKIYRDGDSIKTKGFNTDVYGFKESLKPLLRNHHFKALILGTGGAAKAVEYVLNEIGLDVLYVSRNPEEGKVAYSDLNDIAVQNWPVIVNTTPLGMYPKVDAAPSIPYEHLTDKNLLYDLVYNPEETLFLKKGKDRGCLIQNGLPMLQLQAERAWQIWNDSNI